MTEAELIEQFITVQRMDNQTLISVEMIEWLGHTPVSNTVNVTSIGGQSTDEMIQSEINKILQTKKYFRKCKECGELNPVGRMNFRKDICDGCAEKNHDVVF